MEQEAVAAPSIELSLSLMKHEVLANPSVEVCCKTGTSVCVDYPRVVLVARYFNDNLTTVEGSIIH